MTNSNKNDTAAKKTVSGEISTHTKTVTEEGGEEVTELVNNIDSKHVKMVASNNAGG